MRGLWNWFAGWRWFRCFIAYLFAYLIIRQTFNRVVFLVPWQNALTHSLTLSLAVCRVFLYMWASGAHQAQCLTAHRHREQFIRWCWNAVCMMGKINTMTKLLCICCVKHETFFSNGTEYGTLSNGLTEERTAAYYTAFIPQKLSNERTNYYTWNWCGCHFASKIHLASTLNVCTMYMYISWAFAHSLARTMWAVHSIFFSYLWSGHSSKQSVCRAKMYSKSIKIQIHIYGAYTLTTNHNPAKRTPEPAIKSREKDRQLQTHIK